MPPKPIDTELPHPKRKGYWHKEKLARMLGLSTRRVELLVTEGVIPKGAKYGAYFDLEKSVNSYVKYIKENPPGQKRKQDNDTSNALTAERLRKVKMDNDYAAGKLIEIEQVEQLVIEMVSTLANSLDGAAGRIAGGDAVLRQRLLNEHRRIRNNIANGLENIAPDGARSRKTKTAS